MRNNDGQQREYRCTATCNRPARDMSFAHLYSGLFQAPLRRLHPIPRNYHLMLLSADTLFGQ